VWATSVNGKPVPLSAKTREMRGVVRKGEDGKLYVDVGETYKSHFTDCPHAKQHRKPR
jgi:hypothetical protein